MSTSSISPVWVAPRTLSRRSTNCPNSSILVRLSLLWSPRFLCVCVGEGFPSHAERAVKKVVNKTSPNDNICILLVSCYANAEKLDHTLRLIGETRRGEFEPGLDAYNAVLNYVSRLCHKDSVRTVEAEFLVDTKANAIPCDAGTFLVLITNPI
jgi:hypothetical protein